MGPRHEVRDRAAGPSRPTSESTEPVLEPGTVCHTFGYPEPEIFGFLYVHPDRLASVGIFVPSWFHDPCAHRLPLSAALHPASRLWRYLEDGTLRSWGAKSLQESGRRGEPFLAGDGFARIGEGSGTTNVLTGSGVDEAWTTGVQLGEAVSSCCARASPSPRKSGRHLRHPPPRQLGGTRRARSRKRPRRLPPGRRPRPDRHGPGRPHARTPLAQRQRAARLARADSPRLARPTRSPRSQPPPSSPCRTAARSTTPCSTARGWPAIPFDGHLLVTHQDALLMGGKVQAPPGFADHVAFRDPDCLRRVRDKTCIAMCSGQAITLGADGAAGLRPREMRPLRRLPLELQPLPRRRAQQHRIPRRRRRPALRGELTARAARDERLAPGASSGWRLTVGPTCKPSTNMSRS